MTIGSVRGTGAPRASADVSKFKRLGKVATFEYYTRDGREYAVGRPVNPEEVALRPGEILITKKVPVVDGGSTWMDLGYHVAYPVANGTYADKAARQERRGKPADRTPRPQDALALPGLRRREPLRLTLERPSSELSVDVLKARSGAKAPAVAEVGGHEGAEHTPQGYVQWLTDRGVQLEVAKGGHLLAKASKPLGQEELILLSRAEPLLVGLLSGKPLGCCLCDATAVTIAYPRAPVCALHLEADR